MCIDRSLILAAVALCLSACIAGPLRIGTETLSGALRGELIDEELNLGINILATIVDQSVAVRQSIDGEFLDGGSELVDSHVMALVHNFADEPIHVRLDSMTYIASDGTTRSLSVQPLDTIPAGADPIRRHIASSSDEPLVAHTGFFWFLGVAETNLLVNSMPIDVTLTTSRGATRSFTVVLQRPTEAEYRASKPPFASRGFAYDGYFD